MSGMVKKSRRSKRRSTRRSSGKSSQPRGPGAAGGAKRRPDPFEDKPAPTGPSFRRLSRQRPELPEGRFGQAIAESRETLGELVLVSFDLKNAERFVVLVLLVDVLCLPTAFLGPFGFRLLFILLMLGLNAGAWRLYRRLLNKGVWVGEHGLGVWDGSKARVMAWDEIAQIFDKQSYRVVVSNYDQRTEVVEQTLTLVSRSKRKIRIEQPREYLDIVCLVKEHTRDRLLAEIIERFLANEPVQFGPIKIQMSDGITVGKTRMPWASVFAITIVDAEFRFPRKSIKPIPCGDVGNADLLLAFLGQAYELSCAWREQQGSDSA